MKRTIALALSASLFTALALGAPLTDKNIENKEFDAKKQPAVNEPEVNAKKAEKQWKDVSTEKVKGSCDKEDLWTSRDPYKVTVTAMKNMSIPVKGSFDRVVVHFVSDKKEHTVKSGSAKIDLTSYNSGSQDRDRRVQRYILDAEKKPLAKVSFKFPSGFGLPASGSATADMEAELKMGGETYNLIVPVKIDRVSDKALHLTTTKEASFTYATDGMKARLQKLLSLCNHQMLSTYVNLTVDVTLENTCAE